MSAKINILVAPLNWGLGHATRCIPIIRELLKNNYNPIIASDGDALDLLRKEFPYLTCLALPSYKIRYAKKGEFFKIKMLFNSPRIVLATLRERYVVNQIIKTHNISGIISDNRFGINHNKIPSIFITHQLNVLSGRTTKISSYLHQLIIKSFNECWVPDLNHKHNLSGDLGHLKHDILNLKYIGPLSRFNINSKPYVYDYLVLLSGPEPQRYLLEQKLFEELKNTTKKVLFVRGKVEASQDCFTLNNITFYNYMTSDELEDAINKSNVVVSRSGYTTLMDLAKLGKKAFFIPTPGQTEQAYLAKRLKDLGIAPYCTQDKFKLEKLNRVELYKGLSSFNFDTDYTKLFRIFDFKNNYSSSVKTSFLDSPCDFSSVNENSDPTPNSLST